MPDPNLPCTAKKKDGSPCKAYAIGDTGLCFFHGSRAHQAVDVRKILEQQLKRVARVTSDPLAAAKVAIELVHLLDKLPTPESDAEDENEIVQREGETDLEFTKRRVGAMRKK